MIHPVVPHLFRQPEMMQLAQGSLATALVVYAARIESAYHVALEQAVDPPQAGTSWRSLDAMISEARAG